MDNNQKNKFKKFVNGSCTDQEIDEIINSISDPNNSSIFDELIKQELTEKANTIPPYLEQRIRNITDNVEIALNKKIALNIKSPTKIVPIFGWKKIAVAASLLLLAASTLIYNINNPQSDEDNAIEKAVSIFADTTNATLTLSNGSVISFEKNIDSFYVASTSNTNEAIEYQTLAIPRSRQFIVILPDRSKVWLNASSKLTYPNKFIGEKREVILEGEGYFEVVHDSLKSFIVKTKQQDINVLGTDFNVSAYPENGTTKTTLLEGKVMVQSKFLNKVSYLNPGQQAKTTENKLDILNIDAHNSISWKNGYFDFQDKYLDEVLTDIARWYDIKIKYEDDLPTMQFFGKIRRNSSFKEVLEILKEIGLKFRFENSNTLIIKTK